MHNSLTPITEHIVAYLHHSKTEGRYSLHTLRNYGVYLKVFADWLVATGNSRLLPHELTENQICDYRKFLSSQRTINKTSLKHSSINYYLIGIRVLLDHLFQQNIITLSSKKIFLFRANKAVPESVSLSEVETLVKTLDSATTTGKRDIAVIELLISSKLRISDLVSLDVNSIDLDKKELFIGRDRNLDKCISISDRAVQRLRQYLASRSDLTGPLFINLRSSNTEHNRLSARSIQKMLSNCARSAGISKKVTPHMLRHVNSANLCAEDVVQPILEVFGHKNVVLAGGYFHMHLL